MEQADSWRADLRADSRLECHHLRFMASAGTATVHVEVFLQQSSSEGSLLADASLNFQPLFLVPFVC